VPKEERNDPLFEGFLLVDAPGASVRKPRDNVLICGIRQNHVKLHGKGGFLVSSAGIGGLGGDLGKVAVRALSIIAFVENDLGGLFFFHWHHGDVLHITSTRTGLVVALALGRRLIGRRLWGDIIRRGRCRCEGVHCEKGGKDSTSKNRGFGGGDARRGCCVTFCVAEWRERKVKVRRFRFYFVVVFYVRHA
jgi:hypothetical protein